MHSANRQKLSTAVLITQKLAQLCYLPKTKHSCAISTVQSAIRPKLSTAVLIAQTVWAQLEPKISTNAHPVRVHRPKISTAGAKNSTSMLTALTTFRISAHDYQYKPLCSIRIFLDIPC